MEKTGESEKFWKECSSHASELNEYINTKSSGGRGGGRGEERRKRRREEGEGEEE